MVYYRDMSNDAKFWVWRALIFADMSIAGWCLTKAMRFGFEDAYSTHHAAFWYVLFFLSVVAGVVAYFFYRKARFQRWLNTQKTAGQSEVEILAAFAAQQQADKQKAKAQKPETK